MMRLIANYSWVGRSWLRVAVTFLYFFVLGFVTTWAIDFQFKINLVQFSIAIFFGFLGAVLGLMFRKYQPVNESFRMSNVPVKVKKKWPMYILFMVFVSPGLILIFRSPTARVFLESILLFTFGVYILEKFFKKASIKLRLVYMFAYWIPMSKLLFDFSPVAVQDVILSLKLWRGLVTMISGFFIHYLIVDWLRRKSA